MEWWDKYLLPSGTYFDVSADKEKGKYKYDEVTHYIEHPIPIKPPGFSKEAAQLRMYLTKDEQRKLRRRTRLERQKEKQEKILLGLEPPPKPKVKISNLMRVLGTEATQDPTMIEQEVKRQMAERVANHEARNQERKLTKEERKEKKRQKALKDAKLATHVAVFRVWELANPKILDINARSMCLTGCIILYKDINMVVVEGGQKGIRKFKKLMLKRIKWNPPLDGKEEEEDQPKENANKPPNKCVLVWEVWI